MNFNDWGFKIFVDEDDGNNKIKIYKDDNETILI